MVDSTKDPTDAPLPDSLPTPVRAPPALDELLAEIAKGDDRMFGDFYDQLAGKIFGLVRSILRDAAQSDEVTQEVFIELWRAAPRYSPDKGNVTAWAMAIAHRRAVDRVRSAEASTRRERQATFESSRTRPFDQVTEIVLDGDEHQKVTECLLRLTERQRESVQLAYYQGLTCQQIAEAGQLSPNTIKSRLRAALQRLRDCMRVAA